MSKVNLVLLTMRTSYKKNHSVFFQYLPLLNSPHFELMFSYYYLVEVTFFVGVCLLSKRSNTMFCFKEVEQPLPFSLTFPVHREYRFVWTSPESKGRVLTVQQQ